MQISRRTQAAQKAYTLKSKNKKREILKLGMGARYMREVESRCKQITLSLGGPRIFLHCDLCGPNPTGRFARGCAIRWRYQPGRALQYVEYKRRRALDRTAVASMGVLRVRRHRFSSGTAGRFQQAPLHATWRYCHITAVYAASLNAAAVL